MKLNLPALLSFSTGFVSLSLEILWFRLYGFAMLSTPMAFGFVLMAYLAGIACGAWYGGGACRKASNDAALWNKSVVMLSVSAVLTLLVPIIFVWIQGQWWRSPYVDFVLIGIVSGVLAFLFPIAHHLGAAYASEKQGRRFATVYTSNVIGAALGPLMVGYVLLDIFTLQQCFVIMAALQAVMAGLFYALSEQRKFSGMGFAGAAGVASFLMFAAYGIDPHRIIQSISNENRDASHVLENKHGIITLFAADGVKYREGDDAVYGGNIYDGRTNLSIQNNTNGLHRVLLLSALQPEPRRVLVVGLSIGSWLALVKDFPGVEHIDVVEINPAYLTAARRYPPQWSAINDPRVNIVIDDARRWLRLHPDNKYDLVIMNTTLHWRANASFLLSREFLFLVRQHMAEGAIMSFNATYSNDAFYTAKRVFPHAYRYEGFIYVADFDFRARKDGEAARETYSRLEVDGVSLFSGNNALIEEYLNRRFVTIEEVERRSDRPLEVITDYNAVSEFKYGYSLERLY